ncbi:MAG: NAD(P)H-dependent oxidoreductase [Candidatus Saccharimonadales bacterium]
MKLQVIIGSTRPGRITERMAKWAAAEAEKFDSTEVEIVDLADYDMPLFDEAISPRYNPNRTPRPVVAKFLDKLAEADGYVIVTPEYNHSIPGVLKNAFDYVTDQLAKKPVAIFSHGTVGGARAAEHLKGIISEAGTVSVPQAVAMHGASELLDESGAFVGDTSNPYGVDKSALKVLIELVWWAETLKAGREQLATV